MCAGCPSTTVFFSSSLETALLNARARASLSYVNLHGLLPSLYPDHHSSLTDNSPYSISRLLYYNSVSPFSLYFGTPRPSRDYIMMSDYNHELPVEINCMICALLPKSDLTTVRLVNEQWSGVAASWLWREFTAALGTSNQTNASFKALLISEPCGFLTMSRCWISARPRVRLVQLFLDGSIPTDLVTLLKGLETLFVSSMDSVCQCWSHRLS
jgi:hypothetical protein